MDIDELVRAVQTLNAEDAFRPRLSFEQWRTLAPYLGRHEIRAGDTLVLSGRPEPLARAESSLLRRG